MLSLTILNDTFNDLVSEGIAYTKEIENTDPIIKDIGVKNRNFVG